ncbi:MAG: hypothetical protein H6655_08625 [Ardenticatenaceae bacterium]|nr:hypothetical protein [Ardenticatenaceae bacterium]
MLIVGAGADGPVAKKWDQVRRGLNLTGLQQRSSPGEDTPQTRQVSAELATIRVRWTPPAARQLSTWPLCQLLSLQKEVIAYAALRGLPEIELTGQPEQLYGIEINPYAHELAQITV